jgi:glycosyltransferase involved in cell wall biosynthesis
MNPEKILMAHNFYQIPGGEEESFRSELAMLKSNGHEVVTYIRSNDNIKVDGILNKIKLARDTVWADDSYQAITRLIGEHKPQIAHFQNIFPLISPSVYYACRDMEVPVVQSLRNYRLMCPNAFFLRNDQVCEDCAGRFFAWPGILHACYRKSRLQTAVVAGMLSYHRLIKTWESQVSLYIALTEFSRSKFIQSGISPEKIVVKPNYIPDPEPGMYPGEFAVYVGRLSREKGIEVLLESWKSLPDVPLKIIGGGPMEYEVKNFIRDNRLNIEWLGRLQNAEAMEVIKRSRFLVFPSLLYETFGRTIVEAFAAGKPVIGSGHGTPAELIQEGETGLLFTPGDPDDMRKKISRLWNSEALADQMGRHARSVYEDKYTAGRNYAQLIDIYNRVLSSRSQGGQFAWK